MKAEFGVPLWVFGLSTYAFESKDRIVCAYVERGLWHLATIDTNAKLLKPLDTPYTEISFVHASAGRAVFRAGSVTEPFSIIEFDLETRTPKVLQRANNLELDAGYISAAEAVEFPTENGRTAHAFFYRPKNSDFSAPATERPPLLVKVTADQLQPRSAS